MNQMRQQQHFAPMGAHRVRQGDLVRNVGCVGTFRVRSIDYGRGEAELAHMSGAGAGCWALNLIVPLTASRESV